MALPEKKRLPGKKTIFRGAHTLKGQRSRAGAASRLPDGRTLVWPRPRGGTGARRSRRPPRYWRSLTPLLSPGSAVPERRLNGWLLVLEAKRIPHFLLPDGAYPLLAVPPLQEGVAIHEILAFERERPRPALQPRTRKNIAGVLFFLFLLAVWHGLRWDCLALRLPVPPFPAAAEAWGELFGLDVYRARALHEWWRTVTALTLHADGPHLFSNLVFGLFFLIPLCRRAGLGLGLALCLAAGILGNAGNALTREPGVISLGFSTALFGALGSQCALNAADALGHYLRFTASRRPGLASFAPNLFFQLIGRLGLPLAAGLALLGMLGGGSEARTDYSAHIWGFCCGLACALAALPLERAIARLGEAQQIATQGILFLAVLAGVTGAWRHALC